MSISRLFTIIGDGNVRRNMTGLNVASRETMKNAQIIDYLGVGSINVALQEVRPESQVCIVAAITDLLVSGGDCGTIFASIDPPLTSFRDRIVAFCTARPLLQVRLPFVLEWKIDLAKFSEGIGPSRTTYCCHDVLGTRV